MICIRQDLIDKELNQDPNRTYKKLKLSNRFIDWLFRHYYTGEFSVHCYDRDSMGEDRITFCNWIEPYGEGIWNMSQVDADKEARGALDYVRQINIKKDGRIWIAHEDDYIFIYWYGRDILWSDFWLVMKRKDKR